VATCRGLVGRFGLGNDTHTHTNASPANETSNPTDYEFVLSAVNLRATLASRYDITELLTSACMTYDTGLRVDVESGFQRAQLSDLLRNPEVAHVVRDVHESARVAWLHPGDGDALLASWHRIASTPGAALRDAAAVGPCRMSADEVWYVLEHLQFSETTFTNDCRLQLSGELSLN
jgi:hypothetical protein